MPSSLPNLHPFFVHFPIALFTLGVVLDLVLVVGLRRSWLDRAITLVAVTATLLSALAAASGKLAANGIELALSPGAQERLGLHSDWAFLTVVLLFIAAGLRFDACWRDRGESAPRLHRGRLLALLAGLVACATLLVTASHGGALVYRHGIGVEVEPKAP